MFHCVSLFFYHCLSISHPLFFSISHPPVPSISPTLVLSISLYLYLSFSPSVLLWLSLSLRLQGVDLSSRQAEFGGVSVRSSLLLLLESRHHGKRLVCQAYSSLLSEGVNTFYKLDVLCESASPLLPPPRPSPSLSRLPSRLIQCTKT